MKMTKTELIDLIAKEAGISKEKASIALNSLIDGIQSSLQSEDGKIQLTGFGSFSKVHRKERKGRNPSTGEEITIPAQNSVKFKPGQKLKDAIEE
jgi:DNA-binding protein HU-beta